MYFDLSTDSVEIWSELDWDNKIKDLHVTGFGKKAEVLYHDDKSPAEV